VKLKNKNIIITAVLFGLISILLGRSLRLQKTATSMIAFGANGHFGVQLHPTGAIDQETYKNIGRAFAYIKSIKDYGPGGKQVAKTGLWMTFDNHTEQAASLLLLDT